MRHPGDERRLGDDAGNLTFIGAVGRGRGLPVDGEIAGGLRPELRRARRHRGARIGDDREVLVIDTDAVGRILCQRRRGRDHERDRFANMHDTIGCERRPDRIDQRRTIATRHREMRIDRADAGGFHLGRGEHREDAVGGPRRRDIDPADFCVGMRRTHEDAIRFARQRRVIEKAAAAAQQCLVFDPRQCVPSGRFT